MELADLFYLLAVIFMVLFIMMLIGVIVLLFFIKKKVTDVHTTIEQKIHLITHPSKETGDLAAGIGSVVAGMAMKKVSKVLKGK